MCSAPRGASVLKRRRVGKAGGEWDTVPAWGCGRSLDQEGGFVAGAVEFSLGDNSKDVKKLWAPGRGRQILEVCRVGEKEFNNRK